MRMKRLLLLLAGAATLLAIIRVQAAQNRPGIDSQSCSTPIYSAKEVTRRAKIIDGANLNALYEAFGLDAYGRVIIEAVLCRSGKVTDIKVIESAPPTMGEFVARAVSLIRFTPAEFNWHSVSQSQRFEFLINGPSDIKAIDPAAAAGPLIEEVDIVGIRRFTKEEILRWIQTRPGDIYNQPQIARDLSAILATGNFEQMYSRVTTEDGVRGGVVVRFQLVENPLISEVKFVGLADVDRSAVVAALVEEHVDPEPGNVFDIARIKIAMTIMARALKARGWQEVHVECNIERLTATNVALTFFLNCQ
jgi:Surface antigen variable number repeat/Gram-negative bacterial TonB protein C-terminal